MNIRKFLPGVCLILYFLNSCTPDNAQIEKAMKTDQEWKELLTAEQYRIIRQKATERPYVNKYYNFNEAGVYLCVACGNPLFSSDTKFDSGSGWPSFFKPIAQENIGTSKDNRFGMVRSEIHCSRCNGHLGHVFEDGPKPTGLRYCINSVALEFKKDKE